MAEIAVLLFGGVIVVTTFVHRVRNKYRGRIDKKTDIAGKWGTAFLFVGLLGFYGYARVPLGTAGVSAELANEAVVSLYLGGVWLLIGLLLTARYYALFYKKKEENV